MNKQNFDLGWEYTEVGGMFTLAFAKWQPVNLPHDVSISKARNQADFIRSLDSTRWVTSDLPFLL